MIDFKEALRRKKETDAWSASQSVAPSQMSKAERVVAVWSFGEQPHLRTEGRRFDRAAEMEFWRIFHSLSLPSRVKAMKAIRRRAVSYARAGVSTVDGVNHHAALQDFNHEVKSSEAKERL